MFKKAVAHQSNATPIRSSARRQLVASIFEQYPALKAGAAAEGEEGVTEKELGKLILPDSVRSATFETSGGVEGTVYSSPAGDPLWLTFGRGSKDLIPTLYGLASLPFPPLPVLQIHHPLPPPLLTGAPLFLPAVRHMSTPWRLPDVGEGDVVGLVADTEGNGRVRFVGVAKIVARGGLRDQLERLLRHRSEGVERDEGKFADILCIIDDHLWESGSKPEMPSFVLPTPAKPLVPPPESEAPPAQTDEVDEAADGVAEMTVEDKGEPLSASEVSTLLTASLMQVLASLPPSSLPIPAAQLYSAHILPNRPAYIPHERRDDVVIARSEWKKLAKWMKELNKEGLLKTKETKGEVVVTSFDPAHPAIQAHRPFKTIAEDETKAAKKAAREAATAEVAGTTVNKRGAREIAVEELWRPSGAHISFWEAAGIDKNTPQPAHALKTAFESYITKHNLVARDFRTILLDETLATALGKGVKAGDPMNREEILRRLRNGVAWSVSVGGVVKKGNLAPITMSVKTRQGRKQVTLVSGLEGFGVDIDEFADELRRLCAGSASVQPLTGASPKLNLKEVLVQGNQTKLVSEALVSRGIPKRWIKDEGKKK